MLGGFGDCYMTLTTLVVTGLSGIAICLVKLFWYNNGNESNRLRKLVEQKQQERNIEFRELRSKYKLDPEQNEIVCMDWEVLTNKLQKKEISAIKVLHAFIAKTLDVCDRCNPVTDFIANAHAKARELDEMKGVKGPLHGIPFAVKDDTSVEGFDNTHGFARRLYKPMEDSAAMVKVLENLGAIPFCKTNVPQTLFTFGSDNPIFGTTTNCHNAKLSPGGSSSGSGALVGGGGCLFATGSDVGGSLRIPAHFNGCASIKPTVGRVATKGFDCSLPNMVGVEVALGIIARNPTIVAAVTKYMLEDLRQTKYDANALPIQWNNVEFDSTKKLRIGYFTSLPYFPSMGDCSQTVLESKAHLESLGHTLVSVQPPDGYEFMKLFGKFSLADHSRHFKRSWKNEKVAEGAKLIWVGSKLPHFIQKLVGRILMSKAIPSIHSKRSGIMFGVGASSATDIWDATGEKKKLIEEILDQWESLKLNAMICNVMPFPAPHVHAPGMLPTASAYTILWNLVDFPAGVVTMRAESGIHFPAYDDEGDMTLKLAKKSVIDSVGAPIGIQVIAKPFHEELVLRLMKELEPFSTFNIKI